MEASFQLFFLVFVKHSIRALGISPDDVPVGNLEELHSFLCFYYRLSSSYLIAVSALVPRCSSGPFLNPFRAPSSSSSNS